MSSISVRRAPDRPVVFKPNLYFVGGTIPQTSYSFFGGPMPQTLDDRIVRQKLNEDRRDSMRMPRAGGTAFGKLRVGSKTVKVSILDESAGGFMISAPRVPKTNASQPVELINYSGRHPLRVVWRRAIEGETRIGLQRLPENIAWRQESSWFVWMLAATILGFGIGYVVAYRDQHDLARRIVELSSQQMLLNEKATNVAAPSPTANATPAPSN